MENFLCFGLATKIVIKKKVDTKEEKNDERLKRIGKKLDLSLYDRKDYEDYTILEMKKDVFEENAIKFILEQYYKIEREVDFHKLSELMAMDNCKYEKVMYYIQNDLISLLQFFKLEKVINDISYLDNWGKSEIYCDLICYLYKEKVFFEDYYSILDYIRKCIQDSSENVIKTAVVVTLANGKIK